MYRRDPSCRRVGETLPQKRTNWPQGGTTIEVLLNRACRAQGASRYLSPFGAGKFSSVLADSRSGGTVRITVRSGGVFRAVFLRVKR